MAVSKMSAAIEAGGFSMKWLFYCHRLIGITAFVALVAPAGAATPPLPTSIEAVAADDVRIGAPRTGAEQVELDFDLQSEKYIAAVRWSGAFNGISMNGSDTGASWSETASAQGPISDIDITSVGSYVYLIQLLTSGQAALVWRCFDTTLAFDAGYVETIGATPSTSQILDVALASNQDTDDSEVYLAFIQSDGVLRFYWDHASDGTTFAELSPPVINAASGLDMDYSAAEDFYLSYIGTDGHIHVWKAYPWVEVFNFPSYSGRDMKTAVSASGDNVIVAVDALLGYGYGIIAWSSNDAGANWEIHYLDAPLFAGDGYYGGADVTARGDQGFAVAYHQHLGTVPVYLRRNNEYLPLSWLPRVVVNNIDARIDRPTNITWLPPHHYGIAYLSSGLTPDPFFDLFEAPFFSDGFESGNTSAWSLVVP